LLSSSNAEECNKGRFREYAGSNLQPKALLLCGPGSEKGLTREESMTTSDERALVDTNALIYAADTTAKFHEPSRQLRERNIRG
jgi:hypothetical protein